MPGLRKRFAQEGQPHSLRRSPVVEMAAHPSQALHEVRALNRYSASEEASRVYGKKCWTKIGVAIAPFGTHCFHIKFERRTSRNVPKAPKETLRRVKPEHP